MLKRRYLLAKRACFWRHCGNLVPKAAILPRQNFTSYISHPIFDNFGIICPTSGLKRTKINGLTPLSENYQLQGVIDGMFCTSLTAPSASEFNKWENEPKNVAVLPIKWDGKFEKARF